MKSSMTDAAAAKILSDHGKTKADIAIFLGAFYWSDGKLPETEEELLAAFDSYTAIQERNRAALAKFSH